MTPREALWAAIKRYAEAHPHCGTARPIDEAIKDLEACIDAVCATEREIWAVWCEAQAAVSFRDADAFEARRDDSSAQCAAYARAFGHAAKHIREGKL